MTQHDLDATPTPNQCRLLQWTVCWTFLLTISGTAAVDPANSITESPYRVHVDGRPVILYQAHTWEPGYVPSYGGPYWFCSFDLSGPETVEVETSRPFDKLVLLPESRGVTAEVSGHKAVMSINRPMQLVLEPDGKNGPLMIFANPTASISSTRATSRFEIRSHAPPTSSMTSPMRAGSSRVNGATP